jgi:Zn-dependent protease with chaperone function
MPAWSKLREAWGLTVLILLLSGCSTVPITGRSQVNMVSDQTLIAAANDNFSRLMSSVQQKNAVLKESESPQAAGAVQSVNRVAGRIIDAAGLRNQYDWQVVIVKAREANAFVMPNGKIVVFTGLLPIARTEAGLAAVLGHEVAHVVAHHQAERVSQALLTQIGVTAADVALAASNSKYRPVVGAALGIGAQYGILLPFSRVHESEADHIGLFYMAKAGYDPVEAIGLWERMEAASGSGPWEYLSTHPSPSTRRAQIQAWLPEAKLYYADGSRPLPRNLAEVQVTRAQEDAKAELAPTAQRPTMQAGFWYRDKISNQTNPVTSRLLRAESCSAGECLVFEKDNGQTSIFTADQALVEIRQANGAWVRFAPPLRMIQWPLRVGASWSDNVVIENSGGQHQSSVAKAEVVSYESVTVAAGSFMTFKIVVSLGGRRFAEGWYAPDAKVLARTVSYDARGATTVVELLDYQKGNESVSFNSAPMAIATIEKAMSNPRAGDSASRQEAWILEMVSAKGDRVWLGARTGDSCERLQRDLAGRPGNATWNIGPCGHRIIETDAPGTEAWLSAGVTRIVGGTSEVGCLNLVARARASAPSTDFPACKRLWMKSE